MAAVSVPVMAKARIGHFAEAQILQALGVDMIDESEGKHTLGFQIYLKRNSYLINMNTLPGSTFELN